MTEKQSTLFNTRRKDAARAHANGSVFSCGLLMAGAFILLAIVVVARFGASGLPMRQDPEPVKVRTFPPPRRDTRTPPPVFEVSETYYRTIIENNLFRPLGWTPPRPVEPYRLLGTILPTDEKTPPQAIIKVSTAENKTHIVNIGDTLDADTKVVDIQPKQVVLDSAGQQTTLKLDTSPWISTAKGRFPHQR